MSRDLRLEILYQVSSKRITQKIINFERIRDIVTCVLQVLHQLKLFSHTHLPFKLSTAQDSYLR